MAEDLGGSEKDDLSAMAKAGAGMDEGGKALTITRAPGFVPPQMGGRPSFQIPRTREEWQTAIQPIIERFRAANPPPQMQRPVFSGFPRMRG
jgi:hypothetical protein